LSAVNAIADVAKSVEMPSPAATAQPRMPVQAPRDVAKPADRPWRTTFRATSAMSGPGMTTTATATPMNASS
jgi:hypothetical protein